MAVIYQIGRWRFDPTEPILRDGDDMQRLEDRAARMLDLLCRRRGEIVSKQALIDAIWHGRSVSSNSVAVVIGSLRRALEDDPGAPCHIVTINKRGYRLADADSQPPPAPLPRSWPVGRTALAATAALGVLGLGVALSRPSPHPVELVVEPVRNDTGTPALGPLAAALSPVVIDGAVRIGGRVIPAAPPPETDGQRVVLTSRLILWNGAPELAMRATDRTSGRVLWSAFAAGPRGALARQTTAKLATLKPILLR
ncbi:winged helix-turn-helix domain-containing protein [Sphingomonas sp. PAMC 26605]|uniref:winged helix-turn-helix domain-containing protein n=1 Tax=Sphingomonas sp. PAMC 26605 TaxID=1112214 RepID=UPI00026CA666|nr:winged helix-turn-helix domain-containing protein [Sphingomonas sp. PAMC 26605]